MILRSSPGWHLNCNNKEKKTSVQFHLLYDSCLSTFNINITDFIGRKFSRGIGI